MSDGGCWICEAVALLRAAPSAHSLECALVTSFMRGQVAHGEGTGFERFCGHHGALGRELADKTLRHVGAHEVRQS